MVLVRLTQILLWIAAHPDTSPWTCTSSSVAATRHETYQEIFRRCGAPELVAHAKPEANGDEVWILAPWIYVLVVPLPAALVVTFSMDTHLHFPTVFLRSSP